MIRTGMVGYTDRPIARGNRERSVAREILLSCGVASTLLYVATDLFGGIIYPGYSFYSQTISELGAIGAPSKTFVDPLFNAYDVLALAFAVGVIREAGRSRVLRITGALLAAHALVGLAATAAELLGLFPASFAVPQRGTAELSAGIPHFVLMGVIVLLLLLAMGFGAFALGRRFRMYSFATMLIVIALGAVMGVSTPRVAADQPTPGLGIMERVMVYATVLWPGMLGVALTKRPSSRGAKAAASFGGD